MPAAAHMSSLAVALGSLFFVRAQQNGTCARLGHPPDFVLYDDGVCRSRVITDLISDPADLLGCRNFGETDRFGATGVPEWAELNVGNPDTSTTTTQIIPGLEVGSENRSYAVRRCYDGFRGKQWKIVNEADGSVYDPEVQWEQADFHAFLKGTGRKKVFGILEGGSCRVPKQLTHFPGCRRLTWDLGKTEAWTKKPLFLDPNRNLPGEPAEERRKWNVAVANEYFDPETGAWNGQGRRNAFRKNWIYTQDDSVDYTLQNYLEQRDNALQNQNQHPDQLRRHEEYWKDRLKYEKPIFRWWYDTGRQPARMAPNLSMQCGQLAWDLYFCGECASGYEIDSSKDKYDRKRCQKVTTSTVTTSTTADVGPVVSLPQQEPVAVVDQSSGSICGRRIEHCLDLSVDWEKLGCAEGDLCSRCGVGSGPFVYDAGTGRRPSSGGDWLNALECRQCDAEYFLFWKKDYWDGWTDTGFAGIPVDPKRGFTNIMTVGPADLPYSAAENYQNDPGFAASFDYGPKDGVDYHRLNRCEPCEQLSCAACQLGRQSSAYGGSTSPTNRIYSLGDERVVALTTNKATDGLLRPPASSENDAPRSDDGNKALLFRVPPITSQCRRHCFGSAKYHAELRFKDGWGYLRGRHSEYNLTYPLDNPDSDDLHLGIQCEFCKHASPGCKSCKRLSFGDYNTSDDSWWRRPWPYRSVEDYATADPDTLRDGSAVREARNYTMFQCLECERGFSPQLQPNVDAFDAEITPQGNAGISVGCGKYVEPVWTRDYAMDYCLDKRLTFWQDWASRDKNFTVAYKGAEGAGEAVRVKDIPFGPNAWSPAAEASAAPSSAAGATSAAGTATSETQNAASVDPRGHGEAETVGTSFWDSVGFSKLSGLPVDLFDFLPQYFDPLANPACKKNRSCERLVKRLKKLGVPQPDHCCPAKDWVYPVLQKGATQTGPTTKTWTKKKLADVSIKPYLSFLETYSVSHNLADGEDGSDFYGSWRDQKRISNLPSDNMCNQPHPLVDWNFQHTSTANATTTGTKITIHEWSQDGGNDDQGTGDVAAPSAVRVEEVEEESPMETLQETLDLSRLSMRQRAGLSESSIMNTRYKMSRKLMEQYYRAIVSGGPQGGYTGKAVRKFLEENWAERSGDGGGGGVPDPVVNNLRRVRFPEAEDQNNDLRNFFAGNYTEKLGELIEWQMVRGDFGIWYLSMADDGGPMRMLDLEPGMLYGTATSVLRLRDFEHMYHSCCYRQSNFMDRFIEPFAVSLFQYSSLLRTPIFSVLILAVNAAYLALLVKRLKSSSTAGSTPDKDNSNFYPDHYAQALSLGLAGYFLAKQSERQIADHHRVVSSVPQPPTPGLGESRESDEFGSKWYEWENDVFVPWYEKWHDKLKERHPWIRSRTQLTGTREEDSRQQILTDSGFSDVDWSDDNETWRLVIQSLCVVNLVGCAILAFFTWRRGKKQNAAMKAKALLSEKTLSKPSVGKVDDEKITGEKVEASKVQRSQECFAGETQKIAALTTKKASPPSTAAETSRQNSKSLDNYDVLEALEGIDADEAVVPVDEQIVSRSPSLDVVSEAEAVIAEGEHMAAITEKQPPPPTKTAFSSASKGSLVVAPPMKDSRRQFGAQVLGALSAAITVFLLDGFPFIRKPKAKSAPRLTSQFSHLSARLQQFTVYRAVTAILSNTFSVGFGLAAMFLMYKHIQSKMGNRKFLNNREWVIVFLLAPLGQTVVFFAACRVFKLLSASIPQVGANTRFQLRKNPVTLFLAFVSDHVWRGGARVFRGMLLGLTVYFGGYFVGFSAVGFGFFAAVAVGMLFLMFVALSVANKACHLGQSAIADFEKNAERLGAENRDVLENFQEAEETLPEMMDWLAELAGVTDFSEWLKRGFTGGVVGATVLRLQEHALAEDGVVQRAIGKCEEKLRKKILGCAIVRKFLTDAVCVSKEAREVYETEVLPEIQRLLTQARRFSEKQRTKLDTAFLARWRVLRGGLEFVVVKLGAVRDKLKAAIGAAEELGAGSWDSKNVAGKNSALRLCCGRLIGKVVGRGEEIVAELKGKASVHGFLQRMEEKIAERRQEVVADAHAAVEEAGEMVRDKVEEEVLGKLENVSAGLMSVRGWLAKAQVFVAEVEKLEEAVEAAKEPSDTDNAGANDKSKSRVAAPFRGALERGIEKADEMEALVHEARLLLETLQRQKESLLQEARNTIPPAEGGALVPTKFSQQHTAAALHIDARIAKKTQELELLFCGELAAAMETAGFGRLDAQVAEDVTAEDDVTSMRGRMLQPLCRAVAKLERILAHVIGVETHLGAQVEDMAELENNQLSGLAESFTNLGAQFKDAPAHAATAEHLHAQISVELRAQTLQIVAQAGSALHVLQKQKDNLVGAKEETAALCQEIFGEVELILFPDSLAALGNALGAAIQDEVSAFASVLSSFTSLRPPALAFSCRSPALLFRQCLRFLVFYVPSILALTVVDLFKFCADALLLVASIVSIQTTLELSDLDLDLVIFHDFSVSAKFGQLFSALERTVVPVIGSLVRELFSHFDFLFTEVNLGVGDVMGTRSNCTLAIVLFAAGILTGSTFLLCQVIGGDWLGLLVGGRAKLLITERNLKFAACRARSAGDMDRSDDVFAPGACSWVSLKACAAGGILKALPAVFKGISAGIFLALQVTLIMANQYTCYLFVLLIQGYEVDPTDPVGQPGTACDELGNAFPELDGNLQNEDTAMVTGLSTTEMLLSATLSVAFMLLAVLSLASGFVLLQGPLCWLSQKLVDAIYREGTRREARGWKAYFVGRTASVSPSAGAAPTEPGDLSAEGAEKGSTSTTTRTSPGIMLTPRPATIASTLRTGLDPVSGLRNRRGQVAAGPLAVAGVWDETVRNCFCLNERCRAYALSMGFCGREQKAAWKQYLQEMQEATGKALSGLFLLFPFGALITKTVEYLNTPDLDWGHRRQVVAKPVGGEEKTVEEADFVIEEEDEEDDELAEGSGEDFSAGGFLLRHTWFTPRDWRARRWMGLGQVGKLALLQMVVFYGGDVTGLVTLFTCLSLVMQTVLVLSAGRSGQGGNAGGDDSIAAGDVTESAEAAPAVREKLRRLGERGA